MSSRISKSTLRARNIDPRQPHVHITPAPEQRVILTFWDNFKQPSLYPLSLSWEAVNASNPTATAMVTITLCVTYLDEGPDTSPIWRTAFRAILRTAHKSELRYRNWSFWANVEELTLPPGYMLFAVPYKVHGTIELNPRTCEVLAIWLQADGSANLPLQITS